MLRQISEGVRIDQVPEGSLMNSKGWRSSESACFPPLWPGFKSRRRRHMWVEFVVGSLLCSERFFSGYSGFPLSPKTKISKFQFDQESGRIHHVAYMTLANTQTILVHLTWRVLLIDEAQRAKYISKILKLLEHFYFYILHFLYVRRMW